MIFKYGELNTEFIKLNEISKNTDTNNVSNPENNNDNNDLKLKKSFSELLLCLNKYKEIVPFLNNKLESIEKENNNLKEQINKFNTDIINKNDELIKIKDKEIEELKNIIEKNKNDKNILENEKNMIETENNLIKNDIISISKNQNMPMELNNSSKENEDDNNNENLLSELLNQLIKAKNIISFLLPEKQ